MLSFHHSQHAMTVDLVLLLMFSFVIYLALVARPGYGRAGYNYDRWETNCWCTGCGNELVENGRYAGELPGGYVVYECSECSRVTFWDFDSPVPLYMGDLTRVPEELLRGEPHE